jgi:hypothetical protein
MSTIVAVETIINAGNLTACILLWRELARPRRRGDHAGGGGVRERPAAPSSV